MRELSGENPLPGTLALKEDYEYERHGTRNLFIAVEPKGGWRQLKVTWHRKKADFVHFVRQLLQGRYRSAQKVHIVLDNLNTHFKRTFEGHPSVVTYHTWVPVKSEQLNSSVELSFTTPQSMPVG